MHYIDRYMYSPNTSPDSKFILIEHAAFVVALEDETTNDDMMISPSHDA